MRVPSPAAGRITDTFIAFVLTGRSDAGTARFSGVRRAGLGCSRDQRCRTFAAVTFVVNGVHAIVKAAEDHFTGGGLQNAGDRNIDGPRDHLLGVVHHHHGAVVQIGDALVVLFAFFQNKDAHGFAGEYDRLQRVGQLIDVQNLARRGVAPLC